MNTVNNLASPLEYFYRQVRQNPSRRAILCGDDSLTFTVLDEMSSRMANLMLEKGVRRGEPIGLLLNKDIKTIVTILAAWKIGSPFVPVDIEAPINRVNHILQECAIKFAVINKSDYARFSSHISTNTFFLVLNEGLSDSFRYQLLEYPGRNPINGHPADDLAYIIFTSGSTGQPKGVMISNSNLAHFIEWCRTVPGFMDDDRALNIANFSFDQSIMDIAMLVGSGVELHLFNSVNHPLVLADYVMRNEIGIISTVPTIWGMLFDERYDVPREALSHIRKAFIGGAACPGRYLPLFHKKIPKADVFNMYGPTEITVYCMFHNFSHEELRRGMQRVPIGSPVDNHTVRIVDEEGREAGRGELVVSGPQVMVGYWGETNANDLSSGQVSGSYKTGDIVERDDQGNYHFVGRKNETVKTGGHRIDLVEIERALLQVDFISNASVIAIPDELMENRLAAFVVSVPGKHVIAGQVINFLSETLPKYMLPERVIPVDYLPLNSSGKIDKRKLLLECSRAMETKTLEEV